MNDTSGSADSSAIHGALNRRAALGMLAGVCGALAGSVRAEESPPPTATAPAATGAPSAGGPPPGDLRAKVISAKLTQLAPNVYAWIQLPGAGQLGRSLSNAGLIAGPDSLLSIDATAAPLQAQSFKAEAERATGKKFKRVIITHHHSDHILGLQFFGDVDVIAHEECRVLMAALDTSGPVAGLWARLPGWANGTEAAQFHKVLPNITYSERMSLFGYGDTELRLMHVSRGHTAGDTAILLPREKILFAGDIAFFHMTPLNGSGYVADWIRECEAMLALDVDTIVPGHGPIGGKQELSDMRDYLQLLYTQGRKLFDAGVPAREAGKMIDLGRFAAWPESDRTNINVLRLYSEFDGTIKP